MAPFLRKVMPVLLALAAGLTAMSGGVAPAAEPPSGAPAFVGVRVPPDAEVWFEGSKMPPADAVRLYRTPPLKPGQLYFYEVRVRWSVDGREETRTRTVPVSAGEFTGVDFTSLVWRPAPRPPEMPRPREATAVAKAR
jgi:uncharacterized protein (TIGR03000 family)